MNISFFDLGPSWNRVLGEELRKPYIQELATFIESEYASKTSVYPPKELIFNAFKLVPYEEVSVVIVGQDPYHKPGQAHGLCFSVPDGVPPPPSLKNIFKELKTDIGFEMPSTGCLIPWVEQGILLLNATLTVREGSPLSHHKKGWERFTDAVISKLCCREEPVIFVLWGNSAKNKVEHIPQCLENPSHILITAAHPSPLSAHNGFFGCRHFSLINHLLQKQNKKQIDWRLD